VFWWRLSRRHVPASKLNMLSKCYSSFFSDFQYLHNAIGIVIFCFLSHFQTLAHNTSGYCVSIVTLFFFWFSNFVSLVLGDWLGLHLVLGKWI
jgi:hypothetical protein